VACHLQAGGAPGSGGVTGVKRAKIGTGTTDFGRFSYSGGSAGMPRRVPASFSGEATPSQEQVCTL